MRASLALLLSGALCAPAFAQPYGGGGPVEEGASEGGEPVYPRQVDMTGAQAPSIPPAAPSSSPFPPRPAAPGVPIRPEDGGTGREPAAEQPAAQTVYSGPVPAGRVVEPAGGPSGPSLPGGPVDPGDGGTSAAGSLPPEARAGMGAEPAVENLPRPKRRAVRRTAKKRGMRRLKKPSAAAPAAPAADAFQAKPEPLPLVPLTPVHPDKL